MKWKSLPALKSRGYKTLYKERVPLYEKYADISILAVMESPSGKLQGKSEESAGIKDNGKNGAKKRSAFVIDSVYLGDCFCGPERGRWLHGAFKL